MDLQVMANLTSFHRNIQLEIAVVFVIRNEVIAM